MPVLTNKVTGVTVSTDDATAARMSGDWAAPVEAVAAPEPRRRTRASSAPTE